jgi:biotin carboxyl carrier protein
MKKFKFKINGENHEVSVEEIQNNIAEVEINGKKITVITEIEETEKTHIVRKINPSESSATANAVTTSTPATPTKPKAGIKSVKAPIPGSILKIAVSVGQEVKRGDLLFIMESMKMENKILADKDAVIKIIHVKVGNTVLQGDPLVDLE